MAQNINCISRVTMVGLIGEERHSGIQGAFEAHFTGPCVFLRDPRCESGTLPDPYSIG